MPGLAGACLRKIFGVPLPLVFLKLSLSVRSFKGSLGFIRVQKSFLKCSFISLKFLRPL